MAADQQPEGRDPGRAAWAAEQVTQLYRDHYRLSYQLVRRKGFNEADSADILNICGAAIYMRLLEKGPISGNLVAYFIRTVHHQMAQSGRDRRRDPADLVRDETLTALPAGPGQTRSLSPEQRVLLKAALSALDELPGYLREPYEISIYGGLRPEEIAGMLGKRTGTIRAYLSVAGAVVKKRAAELLQPGVGGEEEER